MAPCPLACQCGSTTWLDTQAYCGDTVRLQATLTGNCADGPATIEILHPSNGSVVDTINANMAGGHVTANWIAKAQTAQWRTDRMKFRVNAAGLTCTSGNEFTFKHRPVVASALRDTNRGTPVGFQPISEKVDAALEANQVHYNLKLRLAGGSFTAAQQASAKTAIETAWNNGFSGKCFHRTSCGRGRACDCAFDCCKCGYHLDVNWVASGEHYPVTIVARTAGGRSSASSSGMTWTDPALNATTSYAHETGHALGQFDEYTGGGVDPSGVQPADAAAASNLMKTSGDSTLFSRHYRWALEFLNANSGGDPYETVPP
jgi:hypothetical protein